METPSILIVEDEIIIAMEIERRIKKLGYRLADMVSSGRQALERLKTIQPDVILMDIMLRGDLDGVQTAELIRKNQDIPIIYLTSYSDNATLQRSKLTEPYGYILKPFEERELQICIDIALHKHQSEKAIKQRELWYSAILKSISDAVVVMDSNQIISFLNPAAEQLTEWNPSEGCGKMIHEVMRIFDESIGEIRPLQINPVEAMDSSILGYPILNLVTKTNRIIPIEFRASPILNDEGTSIGTVIVFHDVIELQKNQEIIQSHLLFLELLMDTIPIPVFQRNHRGEFVGCNKALEEFLGVDRSQILGKTMFDFFSKNEADFILQKDYSVMQHPHTQYFESTLTLPNQEVRYFLFHRATYTNVLGNIEGIIDVLTDITERNLFDQKQRQLYNKLELNNKELHDFAYIVSHDLKAPLRAINSLADWIVNDYQHIVNDEGREYLRLLTERVRFMYQLIDGVLEYSTVGRVKESKKQVSIREIIQEILLRVAPPESIHFVIQEDLPSLYIEAGRIEKVFQNLIHNAVKYMDKESGRVHIRYTLEPDRLHFSIQDNGKGIPESQFERIFKIFQTIRKGESSVGTGIGLTLAKKILESYSGEIWVESEEKVGSTFHFTLPQSFLYT